MSILNRLAEKSVDIYEDTVGNSVVPIYGSDICNPGDGLWLVYNSGACSCGQWVQYLYIWCTVTGTDGMDM